MRTLTILVFIFLTGCTIPATVLLRNYSNGKVRLLAKIPDRSRFDKLPNKVNFYDTASRKKEYHGAWRESSSVTYIDSVTFQIDIPAFTVIDLADVSRGLILGSRSPDVLLLAYRSDHVDTLTTGSYFSIAEKFRTTGYSVFKKPVYYYDIH